VRIGASREQARVLLGMGAAAGVTILLFALALPRSLGPAPSSLDQRIAGTLRWDLLVVACPLLMVARLAAFRFFSPDAIGGSASDRPGSDAAVANAVLRNTFEQALLAIPVHLALSGVLPHPAPLVAALTIAFAAGRVAFWAGYARGAAARSFGFALTFYPTVGAFLLAAGLSIAA
jgi:hypothetical protein